MAFEFLTDQLNSIKESIVREKILKSKIKDLEIPLITSFNEQLPEDSPSRRVDEGFEVGDNVYLKPIKLNFSVSISKDQEIFKVEFYKIRDSKDTFDFFYGKNSKLYTNMRFDGAPQISHDNRRKVDVYNITLKEIRKSKVSNAEATEIKYSEQDLLSSEKSKKNGAVAEVSEEQRSTILGRILGL